MLGYIFSYPKQIHRDSETARAEILHKDAVLCWYATHMVRISKFAISFKLDHFFVNLLHISGLDPCPKLDQLEQKLPHISTRVQGCSPSCQNVKKRPRVGKGPCTILARKMSEKDHLGRKPT